MLHTDIRYQSHNVPPYVPVRGKNKTPTKPLSDHFPLSNIDFTIFLKSTCLCVPMQKEHLLADSPLSFARNVHVVGLGGFLGPNEGEGLMDVVVRLSLAVISATNF